MAGSPKSLVFDRDFLADFGTFHGWWLTIDMVASYGIGKLLNISHESTHILTSGMEFGRKATILRNLAYRSDNAERKRIVALLGQLQNESKRNIFAHAVIVADASEISFIDRTRGGDYAATEHTFTKDQFAAHVMHVMTIASELEQLIVKDEPDFHDFAHAALRANTSSTKSPVPPNSNA